MARSTTETPARREAADSIAFPAIHQHGDLWHVKSKSRPGLWRDVQVVLRSDFYERATAGDLTAGFDFVCYCPAATRSGARLCHHRWKVRAACADNWRYLFAAIGIDADKTRYRFRGSFGFYARVDRIIESRKIGGVNVLSFAPPTIEPEFAIAGGGVFRRELERLAA